MNLNDPMVLWVILGGALAVSLTVGRMASVFYLVAAFLLMSGVLIFNG